MTRARRTDRSAIAILALATFSLPAALLGQTGGVELISAGTDGGSGNHQSGSDGVNPPRTRVSADGRYVAFESYAGNLICIDADFSTRDVFVRDRRLGRSVLVSVGFDGSEANGNSFDPVISADGRYVAFASEASNLVSGDTNGAIDIFLRDLHAGTTARLSVSTAGVQGNSSSYGPAISADGSAVGFYSGASNLVPGDANGRWDAFVHDVATGATERVSVSTAGVEGLFGDGLHPSLTADGRYVVFLSQARLDPTVDNNHQEIYLHDRIARTTTLVRPTANGSLSNTGIRFAEVSANGRFVAFQSNSDNIVMPDANGFVHDVFVKDLVTGATTLVSQSTDGMQGNHDSWMPSISADGRFVAFHSWANNLVPGDTNIHPFNDVFVRDTQLGTTTRVNLTPSGGEADGTSTAPSISGDGSVVSFESTATNLAVDLVNGFQDVFVAGPAYTATTGVTFQFDSATFEVAESAALATVIVHRTGAACTAATVAYATQDGSATAGADYTPASGTLAFAPGQGTRTFDVAILGDDLVEADETVLLALSDSTGGPVLGDPATATLTIADDEVPNTPPAAADDAYVTGPGQALAVGATAGVLANDTDAEGGGLSAVLVSAPASGTLVLASDGSFTFTPEAGFLGIVTFTYRAVDPGQASSAPASANVAVVRLGTCEPVTPRTVHPESDSCKDSDFLGNPFAGNRRLALIENGTVPCLEVEALEATRCLFQTGAEPGKVGRVAAPASGPWLEDAEGRRYAVVGQPVTRDGSPASGAYIVAATPDADGKAACVAATGQDMASTPAGSDLVDDCVLETAGSETNVNGERLLNWVDGYVGTSTLEHPDGAYLASLDVERGIAWYTEGGAALNDMSGMERHQGDNYYGSTGTCHLLTVGGVQVPAAKRPSTKSYPPPGVVDIHTRIRWLPATPYVTIANSGRLDPRPAGAPRASFTAAVGKTTLWLDASGSTGDVVRYRWELSWSNLDRTVTTPTVEFPLGFAGPSPPASGTVTLTVIARDGQRTSASQIVNFQPIRRPRIVPGGPPRPN